MAEPALELVGLEVRYGSVAAVRGVRTNWYAGRPATRAVRSTVTRVDGSIASSAFVACAWGVSWSAAEVGSSGWLDAANAKLSRIEQIKKFRLLASDWLPGGDELTPTMKLKRKPIAEKYAEEIEALYAAPRSSS